MSKINDTPLYSFTLVPNSPQECHMHSRTCVCVLPEKVCHLPSRVENRQTIACKWRVYFRCSSPGGQSQLFVKDQMFPCQTERSLWPLGQDSWYRERVFGQLTFLKFISLIKPSLTVARFEIERLVGNVNCGNFVLNKWHETQSLFWQMAQMCVRGDLGRFFLNEYMFCNL